MNAICWARADHLDGKTLARSCSNPTAFDEPFFELHLAVVIEQHLELVLAE